MSSEPQNTPPRSDLDEARVCLGAAQVFLDQAFDLAPHPRDAELVGYLNDVREQISEAQDYLKRLAAALP